MYEAKQQTVDMSKAYQRSCGRPLGRFIGQHIASSNKFNPRMLRHNFEVGQINRRDRAAGGILFVR